MVKVAIAPSHTAAGAGCVVTVMTGEVVTVKLVALIAVLPATVTVITPVVAPAGTVVVMDVAVLDVDVASVPLNRTVLLPGVALKFVPVMVTVVPIGPVVGVKKVMVGSVGAPTVKSVALCTVTQFTVTEIFPVIVPAGTVVVMLVAVLAVTVAVWLLKNFTTLLAGVVLKFVPVMVTDVPIGPETGENEVMVGDGIAVPILSF